MSPQLSYTTIMFVGFFYRKNDFLLYKNQVDYVHYFMDALTSKTHRITVILIGLKDTNELHICVSLIKIHIR